MDGGTASSDPQHPMVIVALLLHAAQLAGVVLQPGSILDGDERASGATAGPRSGKTCLDPGMGPCPVGTVANGTCVPAPYHGNDCDTHASGYFSGLASLAACAAKVKPCKMGNYISYGADKSCSWYSQCDFKHLCVDCSKDIGPVFAIQKGTRVLISLWDSLMFGRVLKRALYV